MPVVVECACGKRFRAKDELGGKNLPCPGCGSILTIPMPVAVEAPKAAATASLRPDGPSGMAYPGYPGSRSRAAQPAKEPSRFAISPKMAIYLSLFILVPLLLFLGKIGPLKAMAQWKELAPQVKDDCTDFVNRFLYDFKRNKGFSLSRAQDVPELTRLVVDEPVMMFRVPSSVGVQGKSTEGVFRGTYYTKDRRFEGTIEVEDAERPVKAWKDANNNVVFGK